MTSAPPVTTRPRARTGEGECLGADASVSWETRDAKLIDHSTGVVAFEQRGVEVPEAWSQNATNILAQKYFRGALGTPEREGSLRQVVGRIVGAIVSHGKGEGYFPTEADADEFGRELSVLLYTQTAAFNSPVWFNIGVKGVPQQASACFILSVDDTMESILEWYAEEGIIFKGGSGAGVNLSRLRASCERVAGGGTASGPVSFMRGADASAGTIKSGGKTRRAAKMVVLDADHPDIEDFIWCKAREERKSRALESAGFEMGIDGRDAPSIQYQNANNSVRVSDDFMEAVVADGQWALTGRTDGSVVRTVPAKSLMRQVAEAAWECADPGVQFETTINHWHTAAATAPINASNPCSEYVHLDDSACNLASINLLKFLSDSGDFDVDGFREAVRVVFTAQEILVGMADYPTESITQTTRAFRQLGLGYANLGALLMALGVPYDSDRGRTVAASITALMTGEAYRTSVHMAERIGPFAGYATNRDCMLRVLEQHRDAVSGLNAGSSPRDVLDIASEVWDEVCESARVHGVRNSQATVLAPTGTIGLLMDCDTTGIEPDLGLVKSKKLSGGGTMEFVNQTVSRALRCLGYEPDRIERIVASIEANHTVVGSGLDDDHREVFACSLGDTPISGRGHIAMMAAVQPFLSGAISKTVNLPAESTVDDVERLFMDAWHMGLKAVAIYRDGCKVAQPLTVGPSGDGAGTRALVRQKLPATRPSRTFEFRIADCKGYATVGEYADGRPGEVFMHVSKQGSTLAGIMDAFAISLSYGLQHGVPLQAYAATFMGMRFDPAGMTSDPEIPMATSLMDYLFRKLAVMYLPTEERSGLGIFTARERMQPTLPGVDEQLLGSNGSRTGTVSAAAIAPGADATPPAAASAPLTHGRQSGAPFCMTCGIEMRRAGSCYLCANCGSTSGCS